MDLRIAVAKPRGDGLSVTWRGAQEPTIFDWFWLRDHGEDEASLDPATLQRRVDTFAIPPGIHGLSADIEQDGRRLVVRWSGGIAPSVYSAARLAALAGLVPGDEVLVPHLQRRPWAAGSLPDGTAWRSSKGMR